MDSFRQNHSRIDCVHSNLAGTEFFGERSGNGVYCTLRACIDRRIRWSKRAHRRTDVDDAAAFGTKITCGFFRSENQSEDVEVELLMKLLLGHVFQRRELIDAGVINENI